MTVPTLFIVDAVEDKLHLQATHIFDGLEFWPSHVMYLAGGKMQLFKPASEIPELQNGQLLQLVERYGLASNIPLSIQVVDISLISCAVLAEQSVVSTVTEGHELPCAVGGSEKRSDCVSSLNRSKQMVLTKLTWHNGAMGGLQGA